MARQPQGPKVRIEVIADMFGLSESRVRQLVSEHIIAGEKVPGKPYHHYPVIETSKRYIKHLQDKLAKRGNLSDAKAQADLAKRELEIRRLETQIALEEGRAYDESAVRAVWNDVMGSFKVRLWNLPYTASERLVNIPDRDTVADILREEVAELCNLLTAYNAGAFYARRPDLVAEGEEVDADEAKAEDA